MLSSLIATSSRISVTKWVRSNLRLGLLPLDKWSSGKSECTNILSNQENSVRLDKG
jgi:hypothetical protein